MDHLFEIADFDRHNLKMEWVYIRALPKKEPKPAPAPPQSQPPQPA
jgi:hypothetical protein